MSTARLIFTDNAEKYRKLISGELLSFGIECIGEAANGRELLKLLRSLVPDVVLLDLDMPVMNGNEALNRIMKDFPSTRVIILSIFYEELLVEDYIKRGARGYLPKEEVNGNIALLANAIEKVMQGEVYVYHLPPEKQKEVISYSEKQKTLAPMICQGFTNEEIADELKIQVRGVEKQRSKIYSKISGGRAIDFYRYAFSKGLQFLGEVRRRMRRD